MGQPAEEGVPDQLQLEMFRKMVRIRHFERTAYEAYTAGRIPGFMHISIGQEGTAVGACSALRIDDYMASTHRGHGDTLAKGVSLEAAMAEIFGKATGACHGKGGSMHIADFSQGILGANGIVAAGIPIATGAALSAKIRGTDQVALVFFGDGAISAGPAHEALNMAALWRLPAIYVCENNQYAESTPTRQSVGIPNIVAWAASYGLAASRVDGNRVTDVYRAVQSAVTRARGGGGASFIDCETYRWYGHNIGDSGTGRPEDEVQAWKARDPILWFRTELIEAHGVPAAQLDAIDGEEAKHVKAAVVAAEAAPPPERGSALDHLFADAQLAVAAIRGTRVAP